jgi:hypothetical protein
MRKPETEMTFGDFTESELKAKALEKNLDRNLSRRMQEIKSQVREIKRDRSDSGSELEVQSFTLSNS